MTAPRCPAPPRAAPAPPARARRPRRAARAGSPTLIVLIGALFMLVPFWFMFVFATHSAARSSTCRRRCGSATTVHNFALLERLPFWWNLGWSVYVALMATALTCCSARWPATRSRCWSSASRSALFAARDGDDAAAVFMNMIPTA
jgi:multiple sugar transport system permease protein